MKARKYVVYLAATMSKVSYVRARDRKDARNKAAAELGGKPSDYFAASAV